MKRLVKLKIDVTKIEKSRLFKGQKGTYLDASVFLDDESDQYDNNGMITQEVSKDERGQGLKGAILGNAKIVWGDSKTPQNATQSQERPHHSEINTGQGEEIPF